MPKPRTSQQSSPQEPSECPAPPVDVAQGWSGHRPAASDQCCQNAICRGSVVTARTSEFRCLSVPDVVNRLMGDACFRGIRTHRRQGGGVPLGRQIATWESHHLAQQERSDIKLVRWARSASKVGCLLRGKTTCATPMGHGNASDVSGDVARVTKHLADFADAMLL